MRLSIRHETRYSYDGLAQNAVMRLRLKPADGPTQRIEDWRVSVNGEAIDNFLVNSFGVPEAVWRCGAKIQEAVVVAEGIVETSDRAGVIGRTEEAANPAVFWRQSDYTRIDGPLIALATEAASRDTMLANLHALSRAVNDRLSYRKEATDSATTASQALDLGAGVCQDFAHVFIACARHLGAPARYVAGYVYDSNDDLPAGEGRVVDVGQSHGWAEAHVDGLGWIGFDPTRRICTTDHYVRLSWGIDAFDAAPLRGIAQLSGVIGMHVDVNVDAAPATTSDGSQSQNQGQGQSQGQSQGQTHGQT